MQVSDVLNVFEGLFRASEHPDITDVSRYGTDTAPGGTSPAGVKVTYRSGSAGLLWAAVAPKPAPAPAPLPAELPAPVHRVERLIMFAVQLLDFARPPAFTSWEACGFPGVHLSPCALRVSCQDGSTVYLRVTATSGPGGSSGEPSEDRYSDYRIPAGVRS
jgi:hypothetical protein